MDPHTLEKLEFARIRELLAECARCSLGRALALRVTPVSNAPQIRLWLDQVRQMRDLMATRGLPPFAGIRDIKEQVRRAVPPSPLGPADYLEIGDALRGAAALKDYLRDLPSTAARLAPLADRLGDFRAIAERIGRVIDERGVVRDDASEKLRRLRVAAADTVEEVRRVFDRLLRQTEVVRLLQYASATFHDDRMVLPLRSEQRGRIAGIIHRSSDTGRTLFVEPAEAVALNNTLVDLKREEEKEIGRILWQLAHLIHGNQKEILRTIDASAVLDLIVAKCRFADAFDMTVPVVEEERRLSLSRAMHPLLLALRAEQARGGLSPEPVVPIDVRLGDDFDLLTITGPNTGGKTATLKTVGLLVLMAQAGLPVPAATARVPVFNDVLIDVGDEQSLQQSLSTFSAHLARVMQVLRRAGPRTLVLLDELGAGTDPDEGAALGQAIIDELLERRCLTMVTTHLGALKTVAFERPRAENASVQFDVASLRPTFELIIGEPGESNALRIAEQLGLPPAVLRRAAARLSERRRALSRAIAGTIAVRRKAEEARRAAEAAARESDQQADALRRQRAALEEQTRRFERWSQRVRALRSGDRVRLMRFDREGVVVRVKIEHQTAVVAVGALEYEVPLADIDVGV